MMVTHAPKVCVARDEIMYDSKDYNANNLLSVAGQSTNTNQYNARLDHQFSLADNASVRASVFDAHELDPFGSSVLNEALPPGFGRTLNTRSVNLLMSETHTCQIPNLKK